MVAIYKILVKYSMCIHTRVMYVQDMKFLSTMKLWLGGLFTDDNNTLCTMLYRLFGIYAKRPKKIPQSENTMFIN